MPEKSKKQAKKQEYRINIFEQMSEFYKIVFNGNLEIKTKHISIYWFLLNQFNRSNWPEWIRVGMDLMHIGTTINDRNTIYLAVKDLQHWGFIDYVPGINAYAASKYKLIKLRKNQQVKLPVGQHVNLQLPQPLTELLHVQLPEQLSLPIYRLLTDKLYKCLSDNIDKIKRNNYLFQIREK